MQVDPIESLREIGHQLDRNVFPRVKNGGIVTPSESTISSSTLGVEKDDGKQRKRKSATGSRTGTTGGQGSAGRSWSSRTAAPVVCEELQAIYEEELDARAEAYPGTQLWHQEQGLWLLNKSSLLPGLRQNAIFLTGVSFARKMVRSWGFWGDPLGAPTWIGPRHTNFPDGSACAFEPTDGTWIFGDSIVTLLDLHTVWAVRHLHLEMFGRWPGSQAVFHPYERILELKENEHCGCGKGNELYRECCRDRDLARNRIADAVNFFFFSGGRLREPPETVVRFVREGKMLPNISDLLPE